MKGGKNKQPLGYTIIEVMIVLAISGVMFLIASVFISGKQQRAAFSQGVNDTASQIQSLIEQVTDGSFSDAHVNCTLDSNGNPNQGGGGTGQGTNAPCTFLGKMLHFQGGNSSQYEVFTLAGARNDSGGNPVTSLAAANPTAIDQPAFSSQSLTVQGSIAQNLTVHKISEVDAGTGATSGYYAFGFVQNPPLDNNGSIAQGTPTVSIVYSPNVAATGLSEMAAASGINSSLLTASSASICLTDGSRYALINIGEPAAPGNELTVNVQNTGTTPC